MWKIKTISISEQRTHRLEKINSSKNKTKQKPLSLWLKTKQTARNKYLFTTTFRKTTLYKEYSSELNGLYAFIFFSRQLCLKKLFCLFFLQVNIKHI